MPSLDDLMTYIGKRTANFLFIIIVLLTASFMLYDLERNVDKKIQLNEQKIVQEAIAHFDNMVMTRSWSAMYGGVFVRPTKGLKPNPYLINNTIKDEKGQTLIKVNPAWMTRQISELSNKKSHYYYKITSLQPINPKNAADAFETKALKYFQQHKNEKYYYHLSADKKRFNFMGALKTELECLSCHYEQGYKLGDIRGGIRVSIPTELLQIEILSLQQQTRYNRLYIILSAAAILLLFYRFSTTLYWNQQKIEKLNTELEAKIEQRTLSLEKMYQHEKYIKDLLKTVAGVNELLLTSISVQSVLKNSADELAKHKHYRFTWIGVVKDGLLEVAHKSDTHSNIVDKFVYNLTDESKSQHITTALEAITKHSTVIKSCEPEENIKEPHRRAANYSLHWQLAIPLLNRDDSEPFGIFNIYSDREQGFEAEEIELLERLAADVGLILYSHKQQAILEQMELARISNYEETILAFVNIIEQRDTYTAGHTLRVAGYCKKLATALNINKKEIKKLEQAAILHDIGKVATPDAVLLKPGKLTSLECDLIRQHAYAGFNMLSKIEMYKDLAEIIRYHHVRYDGHGYPQTNSPNDVPFLSHIMVVADAFDAMTTNRIYKPRLSIDEALGEIKRGSETQFHPQVATVALKVLKDIKISQTSQSPNTDLEQKRFSYFFGDNLTELYNESYLQIMLSNVDRKHSCLYLILLHNFSQYNKRQGWEQGNKLLVSLAEILIEKFPEAMIFRYHGDDFVLLFKKHVELDTHLFNDILLSKNSQLKMSVNHFELTPIDYNMSDIYDKSNGYYAT